MNAYNQGYEIGLTWTRDWIPGGPWIDKLDNESILNNKSWRDGWKAGMAANTTP